MITTVKFEKVHPEAQIPKLMTLGASGFDLFACSTMIVVPGGKVSVDCGFKMEMPDYLTAIIMSRSGLAFKKDITVLTGLIDSDFRGNINVLLLNDSIETFIISPGDRIAQMIFVNLPQISFQEVLKLNDSERAEGGFGSTGQSYRRKPDTHGQLIDPICVTEGWIDKMPEGIL